MSNHREPIPLREKVNRHSFVYHYLILMSAATHYRCCLLQMLSCSLKDYVCESCGYNGKAGPQDKRNILIGVMSSN